jgi:hypothetical protein
MAAGSISNEKTLQALLVCSICQSTTSSRDEHGAIWEVSGRQKRQTKNTNKKRESKILITLVYQRELKEPQSSNQKT